MKIKTLLIATACLLLFCVTLSMCRIARDEASFHSFAESLKNRRGSGWPIPEDVDDLVGVYKCDLDLEGVQRIGLSSITDISDCEVVMEFYENGNGRIALYDERSKGPRPTSEAYDLEWYADKIESKDLDMDIYEDYSDFYMVQVAFYKHFDIGFKGEYIFLQNANDSYVYEYGVARYDNAEGWLIIKKSDSDTGESLIIPTIKLK